MASIFHQLGGQGPMPLVPGDGGDDAGKARCYMYSANAKILISPGDFLVTGRGGWSA